MVNYHLYVKLIGGSGSLQLTKALSNDSSPAWKSDAGEIAFLRAAAGGRLIYARQSDDT